MRPLIYAARRLFRTPVATALAVLSLAFGIGANSAIFSLYEALVVRPLPVSDPSELVFIRSHHPLFGDGRNISYPLFKDLSSHLSSLSGLAARSAKQLNLNAGGSSERISAEFVSENYYEVLGVSPALGRVLTVGDESNPVVVLMYGYWHQRFGADPNIVGKKIFLNAKPFTIIGVAAHNFRGTEVGLPVDLQIPVTVFGQLIGGPDKLKQPRASWLEAIGRLKTGVSLEKANAEMQQVYHDLRDPKISGPDRLQLIAGAQGVSPLRTVYAEQLIVLLAVAAGVLFLTCLNLSNFLFARFSARSHEGAILSALGAPRFELARQPLFESLILACIGTLLGLAAISPLVHALVRFFPMLPGADLLGSWIDWRVFLFSVLVTFACTLIVAAYPAIWSIIKAPSELLREVSAIRGKKSSSLLGHALLAIQIMIATVLVLGTTFFVGTLQTLERNDTGFTTHNLILASLDPPSSGYDLQRSHAFYADLVDRVRAIPGVRNAALSKLVVLASDVDSNTICVENYHPANNEKMEQNINTVSPGYFSTVGISFYAGRDFNEHDNGSSPKVAIINRKMAADFFGSTNPIGRKIGIGCGDPKDANIEIVGVVNDVRYKTLRDAAARIAYIPYLQNDENMRLTLNVNTSVSNTGAIFSALRHEANALDANIPLFELRTLQDQMNQSMWQEHTMARLSSFFSMLALLLAGLGVYSVLNYSIQRRKKEIGLRLSLGASRSQVVTLILSDTMRWTLAGLIVGIPAGLAAMRSASALIYGVKPLDPWIICLTSLIIILCAGIAALTPMIRIISIDPARTLHSE